MFISLRITQCQPFCLSSQMADAPSISKNILLGTFVLLFRRTSWLLVTEGEKRNKMKKVETRKILFVPFSFLFSFFIPREKTSRINIYFFFRKTTKKDNFFLFTTI